MMMHRVIISALFLTVLMPCTVFPADSPDITRIRKLYEDARKKECSEGCEQYMYNITLNTMMPATGPQMKKIRFTLSAEQVNPREDPCLFRRRLHKVTVSWNISASAQYDAEYLYDGKERPVFFFYREAATGGGSEKRFYFSGNHRLIRLVTRQHPAGNGSGEVMREKDFRSNELAEARTILHRAVRYRKLFRTLAEACSWN